MQEKRMSFIDKIVAWFKSLFKSKKHIKEHKVHSRKRKISKNAGYVDLLNYATMIEDGIALNKDGSLMVGWKYVAPDAGSATASEMNAMAYRLNQVFSNLGSGFMLHVDCVRQHTPSYCSESHNHFDDDICHAIDRERRILFEREGNLFESYFVIVLTYYPPFLTQNKLIEMLYEDTGEVITDKGRQKGILTNFKHQIATIESTLEIGLKLERLKSYKVEQEDGSYQYFDAFLSYLERCSTGRKRPVVVPQEGVDLDSVIGAEEVWVGDNPIIGRQHLRVVSIDGLPQEAVSGILNSLSVLPIEYRWSSRYIFMDGHEAISHITKIRRKWQQKIRGFIQQMFNIHNANYNHDALAMRDDANDMIAEIESGQYSACFFTSVLVLMSENQDYVEKAARLAEKEINRIGFGARIETVNAFEAFLGSMPSNGIENVRRSLINSVNAAFFAPTSSVWTGKEFNPCDKYPEHSPPLMYCVTDGSTAFRFNIHVGDIGHTLIIGPTGSGKSVHLCLMAAQLRRYPNMSLFCFDKGMSMYPLCSGVWGATKGRTGHHYELGSDDSTLAFAPLQYVDGEEDRAWARKWIEDILKLKEVSLTPEMGKNISNGITSLSKEPKEFRTMSHFVNILQDETLTEALSDYTINGDYGRFFDAPEDGLTFTNFNVFEMEELMNMGEKVVIPVLLYIFRRIEKSLTGQPAAILLDEAWILLGNQVFKEKIREWLKVLRKRNCAVIMATQSISDAEQSGILDVIVESTSTKIFLPNFAARNEDNVARYMRMGLNRKQIDIIASAQPKRDYYLSSSEGRRLYRLALLDLSACFVARSDMDSIKRIKELRKIYHHDWYKIWLKENKLSIDAVFNVKVRNK